MMVPIRPLLLLVLMMACVLPLALCLQAENIREAVRSPTKMKLCGDRLATLVINFCKWFGGIHKRASIPQHVLDSEAAISFGDRQSLVSSTPSRLFPWQNLIMRTQQQQQLQQQQQQQNHQHHYAIRTRRSGLSCAETPESLPCLCCPQYGNDGCTFKQISDFCSSSSIQSDDNDNTDDEL